MDVFVHGRGKVRLGEADFVAQGGEGSVYVKGQEAYKIYADRTRAIPAAKIQELAALELPAIIKPERLLLDKESRPIGYTMRRISGAVALCRLFTRTFRESQGVTPEAALGLVQALHDGIGYIHKKNILIVDVNEMNFLADPGHSQIFFIDVDSYRTPGYPAAALMESVRDRHTRGFTENTDWFSFGIVSFQLLVGIHPYKGKHPAGYDLDARMTQNLSVFHKDVTVPHSCYPFNVIPGAYREWYRALFEDGVRCPPPEDIRESRIVPSVPISRPSPSTGTGVLRIEALHTFPARILLALFSGTAHTALTTDGLYLGARQALPAGDWKFALTPQLAHTIAAKVEGERLRLVDVSTGKPLPGEWAAETLMASGGRLYVRNGGSLYEVEFVELPAAILPSLRAAANVLENATQVFDGVAISSLLGAYHLSVFPRPGSCCTLRVPELDGAQVVDARCSGSVVMVVAARGGRYDRLTLRLDKACSSYDLRIVPDIAPAGLNFVTLDKGLCVHLDENEELHVFPARKDAAGLKTITDPTLGGARLFTDGAKVYFARGPALYSMTMQ